MDIVVDTLNICHYLYNKVNEKNIIETISRVSKWWLKANDKVRVMFVLKDSTLLPISKEFKFSLIDQSKLSKCYIYLCELLRDLSNRKDLSHNNKDLSHSSLGRDDFICIWLAKKYSCHVLTNDKLRDYNKLKITVSPFLLTEISFARDTVTVNRINPSAAAYAGKWLKRPKLISIKLPPLS